MSIVHDKTVRRLLGPIPGSNRIMRVQEWLRVKLPEGLAFSLLLVLALRLVYSLAGLLPNRRGDGVVWHLVGTWMQYDALWYTRIATDGYRPDNDGVAFFPLYPILLRLVGPFTGGSFVVAGLLISAVTLIVALTGLYQSVARDFAPDVARRATLACILFPTGFFFLIPYTESLFLAIVVWSIDAARRGQWGRVTIFALLAGLSRPQGCLLALPLAWEMLRQWRKVPRFAMCIPILPCIGFLAFLGYSQFIIGRSVFEAQEYWVVGFRAPWSLIPAAINYVQVYGTWMEAANVGALLLCAALVLVTAKRLPFAYTLYAVPHIVVIATRENRWMPMVSTARYVLVIFPLFVAVALLLRHRWVRIAWFTCSGLGLIVFTSIYLMGEFAG